VTGLQAAVRVHSDLRRVESENVAARLPGDGRNQAFASQAVLITAHWDHKGIGPSCAVTRSIMARKTMHPALRRYSVQPRR